MQSNGTQATDLAPGIKLEVTSYQDRQLVVQIEIAEITRHSVALKIGDMQRTMHKGEILSLTVPYK
jgi:hypothetical protein